MKYKIPFEEKLHLKQTKITLPYIFEEAYYKVVEMSILFVVFFILGVILLIFEIELGSLLLGISAITGFGLYWRNDRYKELKNDYMSRLNDYLKKNKVSSYGIFEFNDTDLTFIDENSTTVTKWEDFQQYKVVKSNLLMMRKKELGDILVVGKSEVKEGEFEKIVSFVKGKMK